MPKQRPKPIVLAVIDGWGVAPPWGGNATTLAKTPFFAAAQRSFPHTTLLASGEAVGLPENERGNSEVGHLNIGAGRIVHQSLTAISQEIKSGTFFTNPAISEAFARAKQAGTAVHLIGLVSDGGIHSHIDHLYGLLEMARQSQVEICVQAITDGRDSGPFVAEYHLSKLNEKIRSLGIRARVCTVSGRYYAMDRDHRWERVEKTYRAITEGIGPVARTPEAAIASAYRDGFSDEFIPPTVIQGEDRFRPLSDGDSVVFFNFRADRARELTQAIINPNFDGFKRKRVIQKLFFVGFTYYKEGLPIAVAFRPKDIRLPLARVLDEAGITQLHVAESEKYAHITYFLNGGIEAAFKNEDRIVVPSPKTPSYDQAPAMSSEAITKAVIDNLNDYDFIVVNYACPDMVGHSGSLRSTIEACEAVDKNLAKIWQVLDHEKGLLIVTADHGNAEQMVNPKTGEPDTEHTANPVPFILLSDTFCHCRLRQDGKLADIAPTILGLMGLSKPAEMTGENLIVECLTAAGERLETATKAA